MGYCIPNQKRKRKKKKIDVLYSISKFSTLFGKMIYASSRKLSKELINGIGIFVGQAVMDQNLQSIILIHKSRTAWPT